MESKIDNNKVNRVLEAIAMNPKITWRPTSIVEVPGKYDVYALGTTGDATLLAWIDKIDGSVRLRYVCW